MDAGARFEALVSRARALHATDPARFRAEGRRLIVLGYLPSAVAVLGMVAGLSGLAALGLSSSGAPLVPLVLFAALLGVGVWRVLRVSWPPLAGATGRPVTAEEAPELFRLLASVEVARVDDVRVDDSVNGAMIQVPRWGPFGGHDNTLVLGVGLLHALEPEDVRALVAHELAHLEAGHGAVGAWVGRVTSLWVWLREQVETGALGFAGPARRCLDAFEPRLHAWSVVRARANEVEADRRSARGVDPAVAMRALARAELVDTLTDRTHDRVSAALLASDEAVSPLEALFQVLEEADLEPESAAAARFGERLRAVSTLLDPHPSLTERMAAAGVTPTLPPPPPARADAVLLGSLLPRLLEENAAWWRGARVEEAKGRRDARDTRDALRARDGLTSDEAVQLSLLEADVADAPRSQRRDRAVARLREAIGSDPDCPGAWFHLGRLLLEADDEAGLACLDRAVSLDVAASYAALDHRIGWWKRTGDVARAQEDERRMVTATDSWSRARQERGQVSRLDTFDAPDLSPRNRLALDEALSTEVSEAWVARVRVRHVPERPLLAVHVRWAKWALPRPQRREALLDRMALDRVDVYVDDAWSASLWRQWRIRRPEYRIR